MKLNHKINDDFHSMLHDTLETVKGRWREDTLKKKEKKMQNLKRSKSCILDKNVKRDVHVYTSEVMESLPCKLVHWK